MKRRIPAHIALLLLAVAVFFDLMSATLSFFVVTSILTPFTSVMAGMVLWMIFTLRRVSFTKNTGNLAAFAIGVMIEMTPFLNALPAWTAATLRVIYLTNREDRALLKKEKEKQNKKKEEDLERLRRQRAYQEEVMLAEELDEQEDAANDNTQVREEWENAA